MNEVLIFRHLFSSCVFQLFQMVNAVYGKTIENLSDRVSVIICRSREELLHSVSKETYKSQIIVNEEMVIVMLRKSVVYYNKPYYIGFSILDISKYIMYDYFYNILRKYYENPKHLQLIYSDTDSFVLKITTKNLVLDLKCLSTSFDFSNLPKTHCLFDESNRSKLFHFKEEFGLHPILRIVSLGSKVYSIQLACCHNFNKKIHGKCENHNFVYSDTDQHLNQYTFTDKLVLKGISKHAKCKFSFQDYFECLQKQVARRALDFRIQSKNHKLSSSLVHKIALSGFCDKRFILDCGVHSTPYGMNNLSVCSAYECI